jgi:hypothetical protein
MKQYNTDYAIGKPYGNISIIAKGKEYEHRRGTYTFCYGIVLIYAEEKFATFTFVYFGRSYSQSVSDLKSKLTDRQIILMAGKFGRSVVGGLDSKGIKS